MVAVTELTNLAIDLIDVRKAYGRTIQALRGVNIQVGRGEVFGLLGPNGAGKSTLVKIIMTVVRPDHALGTILGRPLGNRKKLAVTGYLPEALRLPAYLTGRSALTHYAALARVPRAARERRADELLERVGMREWGQVRVSKYSKGMLQRLGLAQALMNDPELVFLDEPTEGLDPLGRRQIREMLQELRRKGTTVFLNSHLLSEVESVCDRVAILVDGMVARQGTLSELTEHTIEYLITVSGELEPLRERLESCGGRLEGHTVVVAGHDTGRLNQAIDVLRSEGRMIESVIPHRFSLEDVFVEVLGQGAGAVRTARPASAAG